MEILTTKEVAQALGISVRRVQALITGGRLTAKKLGRDYIIEKSEVENVMNRRVGRPPKNAEQRPSSP